MTARSVSWTDPRDVAALLSRVTTPRRAPADARPMGFASPKPAPMPAPRVVIPAPVSPTARPSAQRAAKVAVPKLVHTSDNPSDRLDALLAWTLDNHPCVGAFVADDNGLTLAAHGISEAHVSIVGPLLASLVAVRSIPGIDATAGALWLGANMMSWVESRTDRGGFCLGAIGDEALSREALRALGDALATTVHAL